MSASRNVSKIGATNETHAKNKLKKELLFKMKSSIVFEVMKDKMKYKEYYKEVTAKVSYGDVGHAEFPKFDDLIEEGYKMNQSVDECVADWDDVVNEYVQDKCL